MGHVICIYPYVPIFLFRDSPDFAWRTKNSLRGEFNIEKGKLNVYKKRPTRITDTNQAYFVKTPGCALQEILYTFGQNLSNNISGVQEFRNWVGRRWQNRGNRVRGRAKSLRGVKKGIRGIFAIGFSDQNGRGTAAETTRLLYPWKGEAGRP